MSQPQHDAGLADVIAGLDARDLGIQRRHDDRHPVSKLAADDPESVARQLRDAFPETGYWPLLLLEDITFTPELPVDAADGWRPEDLATGLEAVELAAGISLDEAPRCGFFGSTPAAERLPFQPFPPRPDEAATLGRGWTQRQPALLVMPTRTPADSLAHIGFGGWNESPATTGHVRFHRHLWEICEGMVTAVGYSRMNVSMPGRPLEPLQAFELADRIFDYCNDMETVLADFLYADPDEEDFVALLAGTFTAGLPTLPLWWD
ncbi:DUF4253 domain-containing protein [Kutzneria buriramensis]